MDAYNRRRLGRPPRPVLVAGVAVVALAGGGGFGYAATHALSGKPAADTAATVSGSSATAANIVDLTAVKAGHASFGFPFHRAKPAPTPTRS